MSSERARQKRLERKRRKREERRRVPSRAVSSTRPSADTPYRLFASSGTQWSFTSEATTWPIVRAYLPARDVWSATGLGTAGVIRRRPDGLYSTAFFMLELLEHGLKGACGKDGETLAEVEEFLHRMRDHILPMEEGPLELAAAYAWGGRALAESEGFGFPAEEADRFYPLMPRPPGSPRDWVETLVGAGGLTPADLVRVVRANPQPDDLPQGKEIVIFTEMTFALADAESTSRALRRAAPEFQLDGRDGPVEVFTWTRQYPKNHSSPLRMLGGRQILGSVRLSPRELVAEAKTLSMAAKLVDTLQRLLGDGLRLQSTRWTGAQELLSRYARRRRNAEMHGT